MKVNEGEVPQYYVEDSHPPIVSKLIYDIVQTEMARRQKLGKTYSGNSIYSSKVVCGDCGSFYSSKLWHSNDKYKIVIYQCNGKFKATEKCKTPHLMVDEIQNIFVRAYNVAMTDKTRVIEDCYLMIETICDCTKLNTEIESLNEELKVVSELVNQCVNENARKKQSQEEYVKKYNRLVQRYEKAEKKLSAAIADRKERINKEREMQVFIETLNSKPESIDVFDEELWITLVEKVEVHNDRHYKVHFKNGQIISL